MSNYTNSLYNDYEKEIIKRKEVERQYKLIKLRNDILESENQRLEKKIIMMEQGVIVEKERIINEKNQIIEAQNKKIIELVHQLNLTKYERDQYLAKLNIDGTNRTLSSVTEKLAKLDDLSTDECSSLMTSLIGELKKNLDDKYSLLNIKFAEIDSQFKDLIRLNADNLEQNQIKELFDIISTNLNILATMLS